MATSVSSRYVWNNVEPPEFDSRPIPTRPIGSVLSDLAAGSDVGEEGHSSSELSGVAVKGGLPTLLHDGVMFIQFEGLPDVIRAQKCLMVATIPFFANMGTILEDGADDGGRCVVTFDPKIVPPTYFRHILTFILSERLSMGNVSVSAKAKLVKACEFLLIDSLPAQVKLSSHWSWTAKRSPEWVELWERNVADQRDSGLFCDLTVTLGALRFTLHKKLVVSVMSNLSTLFPNLDEVWDISLNPDEVNPKAFQMIIDYVYGAQEGLKLTSWQDFFHLAQASIHLGCDDISFWCCETLVKRSSLTYRNEKGECLKLWRYANHLQIISGWNYPVQFCNGLITLMFSVPLSFFEEDRDVLLKFTFDELEALLLCFKPHCQLQASLLCMLGIWVQHDSVVRLESCAEKLLCHIHLPTALSNLHPWDLKKTCSDLMGSNLMQLHQKNLLPYKSIIAETLRSTSNVVVKPTDKYLQLRFLSHLTARGTCFLGDRWESGKVVRAFNRSGNMMFQNAAALNYLEGFRRLKMVSFDTRAAAGSRLFLIGRQRELNLKEKSVPENDLNEGVLEDLPWAWEFRNGEVVGRYCLQWLTSRLPYGTLAHVLSDRNRFLYVTEYRPKQTRDLSVHSLHCCVYNLGDAIGRDGGVLPIGSGSGVEKVPFVHSFETGKFQIPTYTSRDPPDLKSCATDGVFFLFRPTDTKVIGDRQIVKYAVQSYSVEEKEWVDRPTLPSYLHEESLQLVAVSGSVFAGFAVKHLAGVPYNDSRRPILSVLENGPKFEIWVLRPGVSCWDLFTSPDIVYAPSGICQFFCVGSRLFVTGHEYWGAPKVTKSFDLMKEGKEKNSSGSALSSWVTHPELVGYKHPELFTNFDAGSGSDRELGESSTCASASSADPNPLSTMKNKTKNIRATHHPPYPEMALEAVKTLGEKGGSSFNDILSFIRQNPYELGPNDGRIKTYTQRGLNTQVDRRRLEAVQKHGAVFYKLKAKPVPRQGKKAKAVKGRK